MVEADISMSTRYHGYGRAVAVLAVSLLFTIFFQAAEGLNSSAEFSSSADWSHFNSSATERLLLRVRRNKFVKKFLEKSKASQEKARELEKNAITQEWPIIAWKTNQDVFKIGDDGQLESSPFEAPSEEDSEVVSLDTSDFSLKPASSYQSQLKKVTSRVAIYNWIFALFCLVLIVLNFVLVFIRYWLLGLSRLVLRKGLHIEFPEKDGPLRQEFVYAMAFAIEEDLLDNPATLMEQSFAACINDVVVTVESYSKSRA